jgi:hypothetical protein
MADFKSHLLVWISSILDHWGSLGTGGIIVLLIQILKEKWPKVFSWTFSRRVLLGFLVFAIFQSWEIEYLSRLGRERDLIQAHSDYDGLRRDLTLQAQTLGAACATKDAVNQTLQRQNRDEQVLIAGCQSQALKLLTPTELKTTPLVLHSDEGDRPEKTIEWIIVANKSVDHPRMLIQCNRPLTSALITIVGTGTTSSGPTRISQNAWQQDIISPAWGPTDPMYAKLSYTGKPGYWMFIHPSIRASSGAAI